MLITVASFKGGVGKTTTGIHLAAFLQQQAPTLMVDSDANRSAMTWAAPGHLPFKVVTDIQMAKHIRNYEHIVIDTPARPNREDLEELADSCDLLILPTTPKALDLDVMMRTVETLQKVPSANFKVLICIAPPAPSKAGEDALELLEQEEIPHFGSYIRRFVAFERAPLKGVVVQDYPDRYSAVAWSGYEHMGKEVLS